MVGEIYLSALPTGTNQIQPVSAEALPQNTQSLSGSLNGIPTGNLLSGFVINRDSQNNPILRTERGDVLVKSDLFLKTGSDVVVRITSQSGQTNARIISVDNLPLKDFLEQTAQTQAPKNDVVSQTSWVGTATISRPASGVAPAVPPLLPTVDALLIKPAAIGATPEQALQNIAAILRLPPEIAVKLTPETLLRFDVLTVQLASAKPTAALPAEGSPTQPITTPQTVTLADKPLTVSTTLNPLPSAAPVITAAPAPSPPATPTPPGTAQPVPVASNPPSPTLATPVAPSTSTPTPASVSVPLSTAAPVIAEAATPTAPVPAAGYSAYQKQPAITAPPVITPSSTTITPTPNAVVEDSELSLLLNPVQRAGTLTAKVIGEEAGGYTIAKSAIGTLKLFTPSPPPIGTTLQLAVSLVQPTTLLPASTLVSSSAFYPATVSVSDLISALAQPNQWDSLNSALSVLPAHAPETLILRERIPNTRSGLVNSALFFVSALKGGDIRQWLGKAGMDRLEQQNRDLAVRIGNEFSQLSRVSDESAKQEWQMIALPLLHEDELHQLRLYVHQDAPESETEQAGGTRFVLEWQMSELGHTQLDGLFRKSRPHVECHLVLRSEYPLDEADQQALVSLYANSSASLGMNGSLQFRSGTDQIIRPWRKPDSAPSAVTDSGILA